MSHHGEVFVRADTKEDAVDTIEKKLAAEGLDLIDHRTFALQYEPEHAIGDGKYAYKVDIVTRAGGDKQRKLDL